MYLTCASRGGRRPWTLVLGIVVACTARATSADISDVDPATVPPHYGRLDAAAAYGNLPLSFEENKGQFDDAVRFATRAGGYRVFVADHEAFITIAPEATIVAGDRSGASPGSKAIVRMGFVDANTPTSIRGRQLQAHRTNYFIGTDTRDYVTDVRNFAEVHVDGVWPGIDLLYYGNQSNLEFDFVVAPAADTQRIELEFKGAQGLEIDTAGNLLIRTDAGALLQKRPFIYQQEGENKREIEGAYVLRGPNRVGFEVSAYDTRKPLVIDPVLSYSTFLGGKNGDSGNVIVTDASGNAYVAGTTSSNNFPLLGAYDSRLANGDSDVFVSKLNASGTALIYSTFIGGAKGQDSATGIALDAQGNVYVTGTTTGTDFPTSTTAYQKASSSTGDGFALKLGPTGNVLAYSTYLLNVSNPRIAVDDSGNAYVAGQATTGFVTTPGAFQTSIQTSNGTAPFALKLNASGSDVVYSTIIGGSNTDTAKAMALDSDGSLYVAGATNSQDFPVRNAVQSTINGAYLDGFVAKLDPTGSGLLYSTLIGGALDDSVNAIALDPAGNAYIAGETYSSDFPVKNAFQPVKAGFRLTNASLGNAFFAKLPPQGQALVYSSFLGGEVCTSNCFLSILGVPVSRDQYRGDVAYGIAVDSQGHAFVTGLARSYTFPRVDSRLSAKTSDTQDSLFVTKVSMTGRFLVYSTLVHTGPEANDNAGRAIAVDTAGNAYLTKAVRSDFPTTPGALQTVHAGGTTDAAVFKLDSGPTTVALESSATSAVGQQQVTLTATVSNAGTATTVSFLDGSLGIGTAPIIDGVATLTKTFSPGVRVLAAVYRDGDREADSPPVHLVVDPADCN